MRISSKTPIVLMAFVVCVTLLAVLGGPALAQEWTPDRDQLVEQQQRVSSIGLNR